MHSPAPVKLRTSLGVLVLATLAALLLAHPASATPLAVGAPGLDAQAQLSPPVPPDLLAEGPALPDVGLDGLTRTTVALPSFPDLRLQAAVSDLPLVALGPRSHGTDRTQSAAPAEDHALITSSNAAPVAVVGGLAAVGVLALKLEPLRRGLVLLAAPLYSRLKRSQLLDNEVRERIYRSVEREPGLSIIQVCRAGKVGWGTAVYHLQRLERDQMIVSRRDGQYRRFFLNGHAPATAAPAGERVLQADIARRIAGFVAQHPGSAQKDVCAALGISPPLASKWLGRLVEAGLVTSQREWKLVHYAPTPALLAELAPPMAAGVPGAAAGARPA